MSDQYGKKHRESNPWSKAPSLIRKATLAEGAVPAEDTSSATESSSAAKSSRRQDPLHGITLKMIVSQLEQHYGWAELGQRIPINCFLHEPSIPSSLKFLRRTPWAREKVEALYRALTSPVSSSK